MFQQSIDNKVQDDIAKAKKKGLKKGASADKIKVLLEACKHGPMISYVLKKLTSLRQRITVFA